MMRSILREAGAVAIAVSMSACQPATTARGEASSVRAWNVDFELSGGFAGMTKRMTITHDGRLVAENVKRRTRIEKRISPDRLRDLDRMVGQYQPTPPVAGGILSRRCADCINYRLTVTGTGDRSALSENGTIEGRRPSEPDLIGFLISLLNETIPP